MIVTGEINLGLKSALEGVGLMQAPPAYVAAEIAAGRLVAVMEDYAPPPVSGFFLYYPSRRQIRAPLKALVYYLRDERRRAERR